MGYVKMTYRDLDFNTIEIHEYPFPIEHLKEFNVFENKEKAFKFFEGELGGMVENEYELIDYELIGY